MVGDAEQDPLFQSLLQGGVGSRDDLSRDKRVIFVKVQEPNSVVFPLLAHHSPSFCPVNSQWSEPGIVRSIFSSPQSR